MGRAHKMPGRQRMAWNKNIGSGGGCSVAKSCPTLCSHMDYSNPGFPVLHYIPEFAQVRVHLVGDAIQSSHPLLLSSPFAFNLSQNRLWSPFQFWLTSLSGFMNLNKPFNSFLADSLICKVVLPVYIYLRDSCMHAQFCLTLCDPMGCSVLGSSVHGIFQARILEWVAISFSRVSSWPRDWTHISCLEGRFFTAEPSGKTHRLMRIKYFQI